MFKIIALFLLGFQLVIFIYFLILNLSYTLFILISIKDIKRYTKSLTPQGLQKILSSLFYKPISIIVPAYNEEETIVATVRSLLSLYYPEFEVIVVNDGSTDSTLERLIKEFKLKRVNSPLRLALEHKPIRAVYASISHANLVVIDKENGGKADALNTGINSSHFPIFCCIDADSIIANDALLRASRVFMEDKEIVATGGIVRVLNGCKVEGGTVTEVKAPKKALECFQAIEYTRGFLFGRTSLNFFKSLLIISGAFGIFRKDMIIEIGGYRHTVGEDMDLVVRLHKYCMDKNIRYKIIFIPDPICWTQVPFDFSSLLKQRNRWHRGLIDSLFFSKKMFLNPKYGSVGLFGYPYFMFIEALGPLIEFTGYFGFILFYLFGFISRDLAFLFFALAFVWGILININTLILDNLIYRRYKTLGDLLKLCIFGMLEFFGYRQLISVERLIATFQFWKKSWGKPEREKMGAEIK